MELKQLRYFIQAAEAESLRTAASRLRIAQSALSRQVAMLEGELGVKLFDRHARGVTTTSAREHLRERAAVILRQVEDVRAEIMYEGGVPTGAAAIGTSAGTGRLLYGRLAERFADSYPEIALNLIEGTPYHLLEGLDTGRLDLAVMVDPEPRASLFLEPLAREQVFLIGARHDARMPARRARVPDLAGLPLALFPRPAGSRMSFERAAAAVGIPLATRYEVDSQDVIKDLIARGLAFGLLPSSSIDRDLRRKRFSAVEIEGLSLSRTLVGRADHGLPPSVATLAAAVRSEFETMVAEGAFSVGGGGP